MARGLASRAALRRSVICRIRSRQRRRLLVFKRKLNATTGRSYTDFAINMGTSLEDIDELRQIDTDLITGVKIFAAGHASTPTTIPRISDIARVFEILGERGIMALIHAENQELVDYFTHQYRATLGRSDPAAWSEARNHSVVLTSVLEMIALAKQFNVKLYLLHQSTPEEFAAIAFGRSIGVDVYGEVVTFHLSLNTDDYAQYGNLINVSPSLRAPAVQQQMWQLLRDGTIDTVCTDHAPHTLAEKERKSAWEVASGIPGFQEALPVLLTGWVRQFGQRDVGRRVIAYRSGDFSKYRPDFRFRAQRRHRCWQRCGYCSSGYDTDPGR